MKIASKTVGSYIIALRFREQIIIPIVL